MRRRDRRAARGQGWHRSVPNPDRA
jgi:hypothetical protein